MFYFRFGFVLFYSGILIVTGLACIATFLLWPLGVLLIGIGMTIPGKMYVKHHQELNPTATSTIDAEMAEEDLPWTI